MDKLMADTAAWFPFTLLPVLLVLLAPLAGARARAAFAAVLGAGVVAALIRAVTQAGVEQKLDVINPFFDPAQGKPVPFVVDPVSASGWHWPAVAAVFLALPAAALLLLRSRPPRPPCPVTYACLVSGWTLCARLALEKTAAPAGLCWAIGVTWPALVTLPFVGWWAGRRGEGWGKLALMLALIAGIQRAMVVVVGYFATTGGWGTHLDVGAIREVDLLVGHRSFAGPGDQTTLQWRTLILVPQFMLWAPATVLVGLAVGAVPKVLAARGRAAAEAPDEPTGP